MRNVTTPPSPMGDTSPYTGEALNAEVEEIASVQVLFPDRRTLDEVIAELRKEIEEIKVGEANPSITDD